MKNEDVQSSTNYRPQNEQIPHAINDVMFHWKRSDSTNLRWSWPGSAYCDPDRLDSHQNL